MLARWVKPDQKATECSDFNADVNEVNGTEQQA
jgi:hypothetical protein